jgi:hypothetical protein
MSSGSLLPQRAAWTELWALIARRIAEDQDGRAIVDYSRATTDVSPAIFVRGEEGDR